MSYAASIRGQSQFIAENIGNQQKLEPWLPQIYSILYAADRLGLSSLTEFKAILKALNDPSGQPKYCSPEIMTLLSPSPTPEELNQYMIEMAERNNINLDDINSIGHKFTKSYGEVPSTPPSSDFDPKN